MRWTIRMKDDQMGGGVGRRKEVEERLRAAKFEGRRVR
jgi:hypothetical protein